MQEFATQKSFVGKFAKKYLTQLLFRCNIKMPKERKAQVWEVWEENRLDELERYHHIVKKV